MKTTLLLCLAIFTAFTVHAGPISKGGIVIKKPGKYYLIRNITAKPLPNVLVPVGIQIAANDVELDLGGYTISPPAGAEGIGVGIYVASGVGQVRIHNGRLRDFTIGVLAGTDAQPANNCLVERLQISRPTQWGIEMFGESHVVRFCTITDVADNNFGMFFDIPQFGLCEVTDSTIGGNITGACAISVPPQCFGTLIVRRCVAHRFDTAFDLTQTCKLFDNATVGCAKVASGSPKMIGVNE